MLRWLMSLKILERTDGAAILGGAVASLVGELEQSGLSGAKFFDSIGVSNTQTKGSCCEAFESERARSLVNRPEFRYTPRHGSDEFSSLTRQCATGRRSADTKTLRAESIAGVNVPTQFNSASMGNIKSTKYD